MFHIINFFEENQSCLIHRRNKFSMDKLEKEQHERFESYTKQINVQSNKT